MCQPWSVWLLPDKTDGTNLHTLVEGCCARFGSHSYDPHVTLFGRVDNGPKSTFSVFENLYQNHSPFSLGVGSIQTGEPPWKSLFLQLEKSDSLLQLQSEIDGFLKRYRNYDFDPHLSLAYGKSKLDQAEIENITFPDSIRFSSLALVETPDDISSWKQLQIFNLGD